MTTAAKISFGAELWLAPTGTALVKIAEVESLEPPNPSRDTEDVTTHDSTGGAQEFIPSGTYNPGDIKATMNYIGGSASDIALIGYMTSGTLLDCKIVLKGATAPQLLTGKGIVTGYGPGAMGVKGKQQATISIKASGVWTAALDD